MKLEEAHLNMKQQLEGWDPFQMGTDAYETEIVDVIQAVHKHHEPKRLGQEIQQIYEHSFEKWIPLSQCEKIAKELLHIKMMAECV